MRTNSIQQTDTTTTTEPATKSKKGATTDGVKAGQLFQRLLKLDEEEQAELAASPADIRAKYEARRAKALAEASESVRELAEKMRAP